MERPMKRQCKDCDFWIESNSDELGECHCRPPKPLVILPGRTDQYIPTPILIWPKTKRYDGCGEWDQK